MNEETKRFVVGCIAAVVITLSIASSIASCSKNKFELAADMVNKGASPLEVDCMLFTSGATCTILATKK
jgi:hypothetical protein